MRVREVCIIWAPNITNSGLVRNCSLIQSNESHFGNVSNQEYTKMGVGLNLW